MTPKSYVCAALVVFASLPAAGERLQFDGSFDSRTLCGKAEGCLDPMAIEPLLIAHCRREPRCIGVAQRIWTVDAASVFADVAHTEHLRRA